MIGWHCKNDFVSRLAHEANLQDRNGNVTLPFDLLAPDATMDFHGRSDTVQLGYYFL